MNRAFLLVLNTVGPIVAVGLALLGFKLLLDSREAPDRERPPDRGMLVEVETARSEALPTTISAEGTVVPARSVVLQPQVTGRLIWLDPRVVPGGHVAAGDTIFRVEDRDYDLAVQLARANVQQAEAQLEIELGRQRVARREWELFGGDGEGSGASSLATREPQVRSAEVAVEHARTQLRRARLDLERTRVTAPFDGVVLRESAEVGQLVSPQSQLVTIAGTETYWVEVSLPLDSLSAITLPDGDSAEGSLATVTQVVGGTRIEREGRVDRLLADLTPVGRMARIVVAVDDPLDLRRAPGERRDPLLISSFVRVELRGETLRDVVRLPRIALHDGNRVYVATNGTLRIRQVDIAWRTPDTVYVRGGIDAGESYVVSPVPIAVDGMRIRVEGDEPAAEGSDA